MRIIKASAINKSIQEGGDKTEPRIVAIVWAIPYACGHDKTLTLDPVLGPPSDHQRKLAAGLQCPSCEQEGRPH